MPVGRDCSRINHGREELIDHILASAALARRLQIEAVIDEPLPSVRGDPATRRDQPSSDHAPVVAVFD
jgi:exonuclease III